MGIMPEQTDERTPPAKTIIRSMQTLNILLVLIVVFIFISEIERVPFAEIRIFWPFIPIILALCPMLFQRIEFLESHLEVKSGFPFKTKIPYNRIHSVKYTKDFLRSHSGFLIRDSYKPHAYSYKWSLFCNRGQAKTIFSLFKYYCPNAELINEGDVDDDVDDYNLK